MGIALLLCLAVVGPFLTGTATAERVYCNELPSDDAVGVLTSDCDRSNETFEELVREGGNVGVMGPLNRTNNTITGRFTQFRLNEENASIDSYAVWVGGGLYQVFDGITFLNVADVSSHIEGPVFNATFNGATARVHNHPSNLIDVMADRSVRFKLTMAVGVEATPVESDALSRSSMEAMYIEGNNVSSVVMVTKGSLEEAGNRSVFVNLAKGGQMIFRAAPEDSDTQSELLDAILNGTVVADYWVLARDDGVAYDITTYDEVNLANSTDSLQLGEWEMALPARTSDGVTVINTDKISVSTAGGIGEMLPINDTEAAEADAISDVLNAAHEGGGEAMYYQETSGNRVYIVLYLPSNSTGNAVDVPSDSTDSSESPSNTSMAWPLVAGISAVLIFGGGLFAYRSRKR